MTATAVQVEPKPKPKSRDKGKGDGVDLVDVRARVDKIFVALADDGVERDSQVRALALSFVLQEHALLVGPPGTAKSRLIDNLARCVTKVRYVRKLYHPFMTPDEAIGPMDLQAFQKQGVYRRHLQGGICAAEIVFGDELFKGNGALLNTHLTLLNERLYDDPSQGGMVPVPLRMYVSASNEYPSDACLGALYDRLLIRDQVPYIVSRRNLRNLLRRKAAKSKAGQEFSPPCTITLDEWDAVAADVDNVKISDKVIDKFLELKQDLAKAGIIVSDRRSVQALRVIKASAWLDEASEASFDDLQALKYVLWDKPAEQEQLSAFLGALDRSTTAKALDAIDNVLRVFADRPTDQSEGVEPYREKMYAVMAALESTGKAIHEQREAGDFSKRGLIKVDRRGAELREAFLACKSEVAKTVGSVFS